MPSTCRSLCAMALTGLLVAGCQTTGPAGTTYQPVATAPPVIMPQADGGLSRSQERVETRNYTRADGTSVRETTRTSRGFSVGSADSVGVPRSNAYLGAWNVSFSDSNKQCRLTLQPADFTGTNKIDTGSCFSAVFGMNGWSLRGNELVITDMMSRPLISARATGPDRLEGNAGKAGRILMWR